MGLSGSANWKTKLLLISVVTSLFITEVKKNQLWSPGLRKN